MRPVVRCGKVLGDSGFVGFDARDEGGVVHRCVTHVSMTGLVYTLCQPMVKGVDGLHEVIASINCLMCLCAGRSPEEWPTIEDCW